VRFRGRHFRLDEIEVHPKPLQAGGPPLWLGARSSEALARAAALAVGVVLEADADPRPYLAAWRGSSPPRVAFLIERAEAAAADVGALAARLGLAGGARIDVWLGAAGAADAAPLAALAERLRERG
jgi:alkanesulfonate monooxygenase SsuD/methylene tetrahydromethanopterin reductase-like flavin-dependent oxidoreductase (luciferase family)